MKINLINLTEFSLAFFSSRDLVILVTFTSAAACWCTAERMLQNW